jgi:DNA-binding LacI/PurR family transcriptional regulator
LQVPDDIAIVGYDDIELARYLHPSITTIRQPIQKGAEALVEALLTMIDGNQPTPGILPTELVVRESSVRRG